MRGEYFNKWYTRTVIIIIVIITIRRRRRGRRAPPSRRAYDFSLDAAPRRSALPAPRDPRDVCRAHAYSYRRRSSRGPRARRLVPTTAFSVATGHAFPGATRNIPILFVVPTRVRRAATAVFVLYPFFFLFLFLSFPGLVPAETIRRTIASTFYTGGGETTGFTSDENEIRILRKSAKSGFQNQRF